MRFNWWLAVAAAAAIFLLLSIFRLIDRQETNAANYSLGESFDLGKSNYATAQKGPSGQPIGDSQKYEKIATLTEFTREYEAGRRRIDDLIPKHQGIVQFERATGLAKRRTLYLGIGVPPDHFDAFIDVSKHSARTPKLRSSKMTRRTNTYNYMQSAQLSNRQEPASKPCKLRAARSTSGSMCRTDSPKSRSASRNSEWRWGSSTARTSFARLN